MERPIEGPEPYAARLDSRQAGKFLNDVGEELFEELMAKHLPTVRPIYVGKYRMWAWMDVAVLNYLLNRAETRSPRKKNSADGETAAADE